MLVHFAKKRLGNWKTGLRTDDRIDMALWTERSAVAFFEPLFNLRGWINAEAIKTSAFFARHEFFSMLARMLVRANVISLFVNFTFHCNLGFVEQWIARLMEFQKPILQKSRNPSLHDF